MATNVLGRRLKIAEAVQLSGLSVKPFVITKV
jgi:hypothetical protein